MHMWSFLARRLIQLVPVWLATALVVWMAMFLLPGDPAVLLAGEQRADPAVVEAIRAEWGLDRPLPQQLASFVARLARLDLGRSYVQRRRVSEVLAEHFPPTLFLALAAMALAAAAGVAGGLAAALWRGRWPDRLVRVAAAAGLSAPGFWVAIVLVLVFASRLRWLPGLGYGSGASLLGAPLPGASHLVLPACALALAGGGMLARLVRGSLLDALSREYVRAALARGAGPGRALLLHALRNALLPALTWAGLHFAALLGGAVATEVVFAWPGLGRAMWTAIAQRDLPVVEGGVLLLAGVFVLVNLLVDLSYALVDPRLRAC